MSVEEALAYPHELILDAMNWSVRVYKGQYRIRINLLANLLDFLLAEKRVKIKVERDADPTLLILGSLTSRSPVSLDNHISDYKKKLSELMEDFQSTQSNPAYSSFVDSLKEGVFLHILCKEIKGRTIFSKEDISKYMAILDYTERNLRAILSAIQIWSTRAPDVVPYSIIYEFTSFSDDVLREAATFLSYALSVDYTKSKHELLVSHYMLVRQIANKFGGVINRDNLADQVLEDLLKAAITLFLCGYLKTLRLPNDEKTHYIDKVLKLPSIEYSLKKNVDEVASISIPHVQFRIPFWVLLAIDSIFLVLHWYIEIFMPLDFSLLGITFPMVNVPVFLFVAGLISAFLVFRLYRLKDNLLKKFRRGVID
ncbi:MAG: hypothetical protein NWE90_04910 [Candidatus Bathyarchaeota archaeon]|nr:hypothetical protein [Candidatus Bathyarchaeota archaeon]